jgi:glycosyltransferase involved in cell wall biosynthesis
MYSSPQKAFINPEMSRLCICVPLYNGAAYLEVLLASLQAQTYRDFTVLIGDDMSTDNSVDLVQPFLQDSRFRLLRYEKNGGFYANISKLIEHATSYEYFVLPGQDDLYAPEFLERHVRFLDTHPRAGVVHSRSILVDENGKNLPENFWYWDRLKEVMSGKDLLQAILTHNFVCLPAGVIRAKAFLEIQREFQANNFTYTPDWATWLLLAARGWDFGYLGDPDCFYRVHPGQLTQTLPSAKRLAEESLVAAYVASLLGNGKYGVYLDLATKRSIRFFANSRLLRRGIALTMRGAGSTYGFKMIATSIKNCPIVILGLPVSIFRYLRAKSCQHKSCAGLIELLHPIGSK